MELYSFRRAHHEHTVAACAEVDRCIDRSVAQRLWLIRAPDLHDRVTRLNEVSRRVKRESKSFVVFRRHASECFYRKRIRVGGELRFESIPASDRALNRFLVEFKALPSQ